MRRLDTSVLLHVINADLISLEHCVLLHIINGNMISQILGFLPYLKNAYTRKEDLDWRKEDPCVLFLKNGSVIAFHKKALLSSLSNLILRHYSVCMRWKFHDNV